MITPRRARLVRVPDLHAFRQVIVGLAAQGTSNLEPRSENRERRTENGERRTTNAEPSLMVVPTRSAGQQLQRHTPAAICVTRDELYEQLHARLPDPPRRLTPIERDVLAQAAARAVASRGSRVSFQIRPGLVAEMLRFYDQLRRHGQHVKRFEELILEALSPDELGRAADRMRRQTRFLADTFREYERRVEDAGACDEHLLRDRLVDNPAADPVRHIIVTVADWIADVDGLYGSDFDLLARLPGLQAVDIVITETVLNSGFDERLHTWWPGIEDVAVGRVSRVGRVGQVGQVDLPDLPDLPRRPVLVTPAGGAADQPWWTFRDREEELIAIVRRLRTDEGTKDAAALDRVAIVFKRPLPYVYLAPAIFGGAGMAYQTPASLPLAVEPAAASLDLVLDVVASNFTRGAIVALLRSPHLTFTSGDAKITREAISALDRALSEARYLGEPEKLAALAVSWSDRASEPALQAALAIADDLAPLATSRAASQQLRTLRQFWSAHVAAVIDSDAFSGREHRARGAIDNMLAALEAAHAAQDDPVWTIQDLEIGVRRGIEEQTFGATSAGSGVHLLDDQAVRYGDFEEVAIVGMVESDWPDRPTRNIFYPPALLKALGWPSEQDRRAAADARFVDLLSSASRRTTISTFVLDDDALVTRSVQLDEIPRAGLSAIERSAVEHTSVFLDEMLSADPPNMDALQPGMRDWAEFRSGRTSADAPEFHGNVATGDLARAPAHAWTVSALETYLECPFKFLAQRILKLEEEPDDEEVMDPRRQGQFVHAVFEKFFAEWQAAGNRAITPQNLDAARNTFTSIVDQSLENLPSAEAGLERTRLLGSPAAAGLGDAVLRMEAERPVAVIERLLEHDLRGDFTFAATDGLRTVPLKGKADRLDLLEDGTFRLIDYKLGRAPNRSRALQLPIYSLCAEQRLTSYRGRTWVLGEAAYLAFKGPRRVVPLFTSPAERAKVLDEAQQRLVDTIDAIARGEFPPTPDDVFRCETCSFATVCRKDYVGDV